MSHFLSFPFAYSAHCPTEILLAMRTTRLFSALYLLNAHPFGKYIKLTNNQGVSIGWQTNIHAIPAENNDDFSSEAWSWVGSRRWGRRAERCICVVKGFACDTGLGCRALSKGLKAQRNFRQWQATQARRSRERATQNKISQYTQSIKSVYVYTFLN